MSNLTGTKTTAPFEVHGVELLRHSGDNLQCVCPFCGKEKFYLNPATGQWDCKGGACGRSGNVYTFLGEICKLNQGHFRPSQKSYKRLAELRRLPPESLADMDIGWDGSSWQFAIRNTKGTVVDIRMYSEGRKVISTRGCSLGVYRADQLGQVTKKHMPVYVCEGEWDTLALQWWLNEAGEEGVVVGVPGCQVFKLPWVEWFADRDVYVMYDNDDAGRQGATKVIEALKGTATSVRALEWNKLELPEGFDMNDYVSECVVGSTKLRKAWRFFKRTLLPGATTEAPRVITPTEKIKTMDDVVARYRKWALMNEDDENALRLLYASVISNRIPGDPIWLYLVAPPGGGKTLLLTSLAKVSCCLLRSSLTPHALISGFKATKDPSLIPQLNGKVFVLKDYTEILAMHSQAQEEVYSVLRGAYDGRVEKSFGNGIQRIYDDVHFTMLAGVTPAIHGNTTATLGERFLKFQMIKGVAFDAQTRIMAALQNLSKEAEMVQQLQDTATGFLEARLQADLVIPRVPMKFLTRMTALAQLISMLRASVDRNLRDDTVRYMPQHEVGTRLAKQLLKMAISLAMINDREEVGEGEYALIERLAFDTAIGFHLDILYSLQKSDADLERRDIAEGTGLPFTSIGRYVENLEMLGVLRRRKSGNTNVYQLTKRVKELWREARISRKFKDVKKVSYVVRGSMHYQHKKERS